jgi:nucleoside-diphosphate-sugar epimerase
VPKHEIIVPSNPHTPNWFGYVDIRDVVQALNLAINTREIKHGVFHICAENPFMKYDITQAKKILGFKPLHNYEELPAKKNEDAYRGEFSANVKLKFFRIAALLRKKKL